jgi:hypothetical protein
MNASLRVVRICAALSLSVALLITSAALAGAQTKPARDLVGPGAKVITFDSSAVTINGDGRSSTITNPQIIAEVRDLINGLPVSNTSRMFCPDDLMIPAWLTFSTSAAATPYAKVEFQLGGCPFARVFQHGAGERPTLGGSTLGTVYAKIKSLFAAAS